jgi:transcriptional regulator with XRE-family HTH domain
MSDSQALIDGAKLKSMRIQARLTRPALARKTGLSSDHIFKIEGGKRGASEISVGLLADALGCDEAALMPDKVAA